MSEEKSKNKIMDKTPVEVIEEKIPKYIIGAFSLAAALAWNEAFKGLIEEKFGNTDISKYKFIYAGMITLFLIFVVVIVYYSTQKYYDVKEKLNGIMNKKPIKAFCALRSNSLKMMNASGQVLIEENLENDEIIFKVSAFGLEPNSVHAFHVHASGNLSNGCASLGPHYNPYDKSHGYPHSNDSHLGDLPNLRADNAGHIDTMFTSKLLKLRGDNHNILGRSLVIHAGEDDYGEGGTIESTLTGNSGERLMCGVIGLFNENKMSNNSENKKI